MAKARSAYAKPKAEAPDPRFAPRPDDDAAAAPASRASSATGLSVQPQAAAAQSPAAKAFRRELARFERIKTQLAEMNLQCQQHRQQLHELLQPLEAEHQDCMRQMALALDPWIDVKPRGLSKLQREMALAIICNLSAQLAELGDAEMAELHQRRSAQLSPEMQPADSEADDNSALTEFFGRMYRDLFGTEPPPDLDLSDPDAVQRATMEKMATRATEEEERRQATAEARKARRKPSAAQQQAEQAQQDADTMLRGIYRQLASALHPDRASDDAERQRKNALMGEANAAYERKDLVALLNLQLQAELVDPDHLEKVSDAKLKSLTLLLKRQVADLERERQIEQERWWHELDLPWGFPLTETPLAVLRQDAHDELAHSLYSMKIDIETASDLATLKPWLTQQRRLEKQAERRMMRDFPF